MQVKSLTFLKMHQNTRLKRGQYYRPKYPVIQTVQLHMQLKKMVQTPGFTQFISLKNGHWVRSVTFAFE